ncbi:hypothetical protein RHGRI_026574 [Rhododendron griersonianum]|uniref:Myb/SANT-like domain-containing protein n=1 Tax=Rhododendron griersonianum TaxID=479676 RepID=A0AAV6IX50_9ERIC|nr:hypothetical protein RHGRI_026574 [Rhododendron griersonianum]
MASAASNATSTCAWPTRLCSCGSGPCIPSIAGPRAKNPGRHYYRCPRIPDDRSRDFTGPSHGYSFDGHNISARILAIENGIRVITSMVSPRGGRGRGIRTSPWKGLSQASQQPNRNVIDRAKWTPSLTKCLLEACAEESDEYGRALTGFSSHGWTRIVNAFATKTGTFIYKKEQLKNKHDRLKDDWKAWILVAEDTSQTGLGRDPYTGAITGPEHWWATMLTYEKGNPMAMPPNHKFFYICEYGNWEVLLKKKNTNMYKTVLKKSLLESKRNSNVAKFKDKGLEHEELMGCVFRDVTAMGNDAMFPGDGINEIGEGSDESDGPGGLHRPVRQSDDFNNTTTPVSRKGKQPVGEMSKLGSGSSAQKRKFNETSDYESGSIAQSLDRFKSTPSIIINRSGRRGIDDCVKKIKTLPFFENEGENEDFFIWACNVFGNKQHKIDVFCEVQTIALMIKWLRVEHADALRKYFKAPPSKRGLEPPQFPIRPPSPRGTLFPQGSAAFHEGYQPFPPSRPPFPPGYEAFRHESVPFPQGVMDPSRGNNFGNNNENAGIGNNFFGQYADSPNDQHIYAYNNYYNTANNASMLGNGIDGLSLQKPSDSSNANQGVWYGSGTPAFVQHTPNFSSTSTASTWDGFWNGGPEWGDQQGRTSLEGTSNQWAPVSMEESQYGGPYDGTRYATCNRDTPSTSQMQEDEAYPMGNTRLVAEEVNEAESDAEEGNEEESDEEEDEEESDEESDNEEESDEEECSKNNDFTNAVHQRDLDVIQSLMEEVNENRPNKKNRIPYLTSANNGFEWVMSALNSENHRKCPEVFGMKKEVFGMLCNEMVNKYGWNTGTKRAVSVVESLAMFLQLLRGETLKQIQEQFQRGQATCSRQINKVLKCMLKLAADEIKPKRDDNDPHPYLQARPQYRHFKDCIGAMDGHTYHLEDFRRRATGRLGDIEYFNRWHSSLRSVIERTFRVWKNRWQMMKIPTYYPLARHKMYVLASMAIHNFIIRNCPDDEALQEALRDDENYENDDNPDVHPQYAEMEAAEDILFPLHANDSNMTHVRDEIMTKMKFDRRRPRRS